VICRQLEDELAGAHNHLCSIRIRNNLPKSYGNRGSSPIVAA
jgi:hypothetical protein